MTVDGRKDGGDGVVKMADVAKIFPQLLRFFLLADFVPEVFFPLGVFFFPVLRIGGYILWCIYF
ncbi:hypothetical protein VZ95_04760 [Elstera litoralis]|uniref:Uncharacterized protein n=1 Tax=Elstera litoralis TaxID=552518 RepID=A0A0F3IXY8_9PROT|nr:hypothetical protein VZ95_04760 [Elstera litoralis]